MNIFYLDRDIKKCAKYHCDKHVVKMMIEYVQILSTVNRLNGLEQGYKMTHVGHPCVKWCNESLSNWRYVFNLACELEYEYERRYHREHRSAWVLVGLARPNIIDKGFTEPPQCMPYEYRCDDCVKAYRNYYIGEKARFAQWRYSEVPYWFNYERKFIK